MFLGVAFLAKGKKYLINVAEELVINVPEERNGVALKKLIAERVMRRHLLKIC